MQETTTSTWEDLRARLAGDLEPVRPFAPTRWILPAVGLAALLGALVLWRAFGWRADRETLGMAWMWGLTAVELAVALALLAVVLREAVPARSSSLQALFSLAGTAVAVHVAVGLATFARSPVFVPAASAWSEGLDCFRYEVLLGIPVALFALWLAGRGLTTRPWRVGALGGLGAGLAADSLWRLVCPFSQPAHAFAWHSAGIAAVSALGLLAAVAWESVRIRRWRQRGRAAGVSRVRERDTLPS